MDVRQRRRDILGVIRQEGSVRLSDLVSRYGVASVTIHRDLGALAEDGLIERFHGGARALSRSQRKVVTDWTTRLETQKESKRAIAKAALAEVKDGSTIFVDASSTALALALELETRPPSSLTLVTNSPAIAYQLHAESIHVVVTPGDLDQSVKVIKGTWTVEFLSTLSFSTVFVSAIGVTEGDGLVTTRREIAEVCSTAIGRSARAIGLVSSSKFDQPGLTTLALPQEIDLLITDADADPGVISRYEQAGFKIQIAGYDSA